MQQKGKQMTDYDHGGDMNMQIAELDTGLANAAEMAAAFNAELATIRETLGRTGSDVSGLERSLSNGLQGAIRGAIVYGDSLSESLRKVAQSMISSTLNAATSSVSTQLGAVLAQGIAGVLPFANGAGFSQGRVVPFASGGIVSGPVRFPMRGGLGLMGEAGPEAIMPLARGADGKLGVRSQNGRGPVNVVMNISTPDVDSFRRTQGQIATQLSRAIGRSQRYR